MKISQKEIYYNIPQKVESLVKKHGCKNKTIIFLKKQLEKCEKLWSKFSSDCLAFEIIFCQLSISWLERGMYEKYKNKKG